MVTPQLSDRSFNYGDGIFTTMAVHAAKVQLLPLHMKRMLHAASQLEFGPIDWLSVEQQIHTSISMSEQVIKLLISRGNGGRGYSPEGINTPQCFISTSSLPDYTTQQKHGVRMLTAELQLAVQPVLAGLKHTNRLEQVLLKQEQLRRNTDDLLVLDQQGYLTEAIAANVFFYRQGNWFTPSLNRAGVKGVMRDFLLSQIEAAEVNWQLSELAQVESMFICNSLMKIVPVQSVNGVGLNMAPVQQLSRQIKW